MCHTQHTLHSIVLVDDELLYDRNSLTLPPLHTVALHATRPVTAYSCRRDVHTAHLLCCAPLSQYVSAGEGVLQLYDYDTTGQMGDREALN